MKLSLVLFLPLIALSLVPFRACDDETSSEKLAPEPDHTPEPEQEKAKDPSAQETDTPAQEKEKELLHIDHVDEEEDISSAGLAIKPPADEGELKEEKPAQEKARFEDTVKTEQGGTDHNALLKSDEAKRNKVGFLLSMVHKFSEKVALKKRDDNKINQELIKKVDQLKPEDMLKELCPRSFGLCERWVNKSFKRNSPTILHIAHTIKDRPEGVDPKRLFMFKMYEAGAGKLVENGVDEALDAGINIVANKNPYLLVPITAVDFAISARYGR